MKTLNDGIVVVQLTIEPHNCWSCGVVYGLTQDFEKRKRDTGDSFYCPNGHGTVFGESNKEHIQTLEKRLRAEQDRVAQLANDNMDLAQKQRALQRRVKAGTCAFCHRNFQNVKRHMDTKHGKTKPA